MKRRIAAACACVFAIMVIMSSALAVGQGKQVPDFELTTFDGEAFRLSDCRGRVVYLNLWATWCAPCLDELPDIQRLSEAHPDELVTIAVSLDATREEAETFVKKSGFSFNVAMDEGSVLSQRLFPTKFIPVSVFIDPDGVVSSLVVGALNYESMEKCYQKALGQ